MKMSRLLSLMTLSVVVVGCSGRCNVQIKMHTTPNRLTSELISVTHQFIDLKI